METITSTVLYHANCYDGFASAWVARKFLGGNVKFVPMQYGDPLPNLEGRVFMLDYSRPREEILEMQKYRTVVVLDHHKTAEAALQGIPNCVFDMNKSGAHLTWDHFSDKPLPTFIEYIEDRDLWRFIQYKSREVAAWLRSYPMDFDTWDEIINLFDGKLAGVFLEGESILRFQSQQVDQMCQAAVLMKIGGQVVPIVNASVFFSEVGERLCELNPDAPFAGYHFDRADGKRQWGFRSKGFDVSEIAKKYGGGGHRQASGFITDPSWRGDK